jgi:hypothetical protein
MAGVPFSRRWSSAKEGRTTMRTGRVRLGVVDVRDEETVAI